ncbi:MAG TPA: hypothetical protein VHG51_13345 [Longimicrobiaceae bacterium]|nr:hypothetical protein [Longimicrobiaceae bacterium]
MRDGNGSWGAGEAGTLRRLLLALLLLGIAGLAAELVLLEHTESLWQWVPLAALGAALACALAVALRPSARTVRALQAVMAVCVAAGALGFWLHLRGNLEWELESDPSLGGWPLLRAALYGATPALAPGALAQLGLLGLALTHGHPALRRDPPRKERP